MHSCYCLLKDLTRHKNHHHLALILPPTLLASHFTPNYKDTHYTSCLSHIPQHFNSLTHTKQETLATLKKFPLFCILPQWPLPGSKGSRRESSSASLAMIQLLERASGNWTFSLWRKCYMRCSAP